MRRSELKSMSKKDIIEWIELLAEWEVLELEE
jgi:hypothetical protein